MANASTSSSDLVAVLVRRAIRVIGMAILQDHPSVLDDTTTDDESKRLSLVLQGIELVPSWGAFLQSYTPTDPCLDVATLEIDEVGGVATRILVPTPVVGARIGRMTGNLTELGLSAERAARTLLRDVLLPFQLGGLRFTCRAFDADYSPENMMGLHQLQIFGDYCPEREMVFYPTSATLSHYCGKVAGTLTTLEFLTSP